MPYFRLTRWVRADAATLFSALVDLGSLRILDAFVATRLDVVSFRCFAIVYLPSVFVVWLMGESPPAHLRSDPVCALTSLYCRAIAGRMYT